MTGSLLALLAAVAAFVGSHFVLSSRPLRGTLVGTLGEWGFRGVYSALALALLIWVIVAYNGAPWIEVWSPPTALRHVSLTIMPIACILIVASYSRSNPTIVGMDTGRIASEGPAGIFRITRHPAMWGIGLWAISHLLANGDAAAIVLFGGMAILAFGGAAHLDVRKRADAGEAWAAYAASTSFVPFVASMTGRTSVRFADVGWRSVALGLGLYALLLTGHSWLFGVNPLAAG